MDYTGSWVVPADEISPIWGLSYRDISLEGYLHHRSQGVTPFLNSPFVRRPYGLKRSTGGPPSPSDFAQPLTSLARVIPVPAEDSLAAADHALDQARMAAEKLDWPGAVRSIAEAGKQIASLEDQVKRSQDSSAAGALWELEQVRERINHALSDAAAIKIVSNSDRSELVAGEGFSVRAEVIHRNDVPATFSKPELDAAFRLEHHEAGRERRLDEFQRRGSRRGANAARAGRFSLSVSAAARPRAHARRGRRLRV